MSAYLIAAVQVTKPAQYEDYKRLSTLAMRAYDAKGLVRGGESRHLEGRARNAREGAAIMNMFIVQGM